MKKSLNELFSLIKKTKAPMVVYDVNSDESYILMDMTSYERLITEPATVESTEKPELEAPTEEVPVWKTDIAENIKAAARPTKDMETEAVPGLATELVEFMPTEIESKEENNEESTETLTEANS